jgi:NADPH:quinone reductase-like Zn-dependent oxidoreductase
MKAIVYRRFGSPDVLHLEEVEKPTPKDNEVLIKVHAASANVGDWRALRGTPFLVRLMMGPIRPKVKILGAEVAGRVEAVGSNAKRFQVGDEVFGDLADCGRGGFAEYVCAREDVLALKPANMTFEEVATVPFGAGTALQGLRDKGQIQPGLKVLINGASGGVGMFAVQIAKSFGAEVTGVCSTAKMDMVRSIGADHVIDYTKEDFTRNGQHYDLILNCAANRSIFDYKRALSPKGIYVMVGGKGAARLFETMLLGPFIAMAGSKKMGYIGMTKANKEDMALVRELLEAGKLVPVVDKRLPLSEAAEAFRYYEEGHAKGRVVITVEDSNQ